MRFARYSAAFLKKQEKEYNFDYFNSLIKLLIKKGFKIKAYKIVCNFTIKIRLYFRLLYRKKNKINLMKRNKKIMLEKPYIDMKNLNNKINFNFFKMFIYIVENYAPLISFLKRKVAAKTYNLPYMINKYRARMIFLRWFIKFSIERKEKQLSDKLFNEFLDIYYGTGRTLRKIEEYYDEGKNSYPFIKYLKMRKKFSSIINKKYKVRK